MTVAYSIDPASPSITAINLSRALDRLERKILSTPPDPRLLKSGYERSKTSANLEYARTLLLRLEHSSSGLKPQIRQSRARDSLLAQRALLKRLSDRLHQLDQANDDFADTSSEGEDLLGEDDDDVAVAPPVPATPSSSLPQRNTVSFAAAAQEPPPFTLRNRFAPAPAASTSPLFNPTTEPLSPTAQREAEESTQADLTASLSSMSAQLKAQAVQFGASLEADKDITARAGEGLEKSRAGMDAASRKMGTLRRMSEGKGLWGRMMLYAWIGALWVVAILLVFVGPKLRF